jgi:hypothetical protein
MDQHHPRDLVTWIEEAKTPTEESRVLRDVVLQRRLARFEDVAEAVAAELLERDRLRAGGDAATMERLRGRYVVAARRLLQAQNGITIRITPGPLLSVPSPAQAGAAAALAWRRPVGVYAALGGFLAAFQHIVQRHVFQGRAVDLTSGLVLAAYVAVGIMGVRWWRTRAEASRQPRWTRASH